MIDPRDIPWGTLRARALAASTHAYAPYSTVRVGAAALTEDGTVVEGANVENASYGLTLCAECSLVSDLARVGGGKLVAVAIVGGDGAPLSPCGRCRQLLFEHGGADLLVDNGPSRPARTLATLLPDAFGPDDLATRS
ncbi:MAG: cytidine deaminase [Acidimicrobiales bacterium]